MIGIYYSSYIYGPSAASSIKNVTLRIPLRLVKLLTGTTWCRITKKSQKPRCRNEQEPLGLANLPLNHLQTQKKTTIKINKKISATTTTRLGYNHSNPTSNQLRAQLPNLRVSSPAGHRTRQQLGLLQGERLGEVLVAPGHRNRKNR